MTASRSERYDRFNYEALAYNGCAMITFVINKGLKDYCSPRGPFSRRSTALTYRFIPTKLTFAFFAHLARRSRQPLAFFGTGHVNSGADCPIDVIQAPANVFWCHVLL